MNDIPFPRALKRVLLLSLVLSLFVGYYSLVEAFGLNDLSDQKQVMAQLKFSGSSEMEAFFRAGTKSHLGYLESNRTSRQVILGLLWMSTFLLIVRALRVLRQSDENREKSVVWLQRACLAVAILRFIDGAQNTALWFMTGKTLDKMLATGELPTLAQIQPNQLPWMMASGATIYAFLVAGTFLTLSMYFGSEKVMQQISKLQTAPR